MVVLLCAVPFLCASCLALGIPKTPGLEPPPSKPEGEIDERLVGTWELEYRKKGNGEKRFVDPSVRTLIEFTKNGDIIFNQVDREKEDQLKRATGRYSVTANKISVSDSEGHDGQWKYEVSDDKLIIMMSADGEEIHCRKVP